MGALPEGYELRAPRLDEAAAVADLVSAVEVELNGVPDTSAEWMEWHWAHPDLDRERDTLVVVAPDGRLVGYTSFEGAAPWTQVEGDGYVDPAMVGLGIGTALVDWVEERAAREAGKASPGAEVLLRHLLWTQDERARALLEARGWRICRWFYEMIVDLQTEPAEPAPVQGIEIRSMRPGEERAVWAADDEAFQDHWGYVTHPFDDWLHHQLGREEADPELILVAIDGGEVGGFAINFPKHDEDPTKGWVQVLGVRPHWRRRGIGLALLQHSFRALQDRGCERVGLGVDAENQNGAVALYEKAGMRVYRKAVAYETVIREAAEPT